MDKITNLFNHLKNELKKYPEEGYSNFIANFLFLLKEWNELKNKPIIK